MTITHTSSVKILAMIEQDPHWHPAELHHGFRVGAPDQITFSTILNGICTVYPQVDILEVTVPELPNHWFYLIRNATQEELAKGEHIMTLKGELVEGKHNTSWVDKKIFISSSDGYCFTQALEDAEQELKRMVEHPEQYPELMPPPFQVIGSLY